ncbi:MAG: (2Fe-2S) ferredoxin domain-containing protein [Cyanobacteria bacterium SID2]|nr:(2Fe-2S) ferredoxin domain-containing protein [Cyanobacteria bacterium SID2]MBP0006364.1 (2Fe-2S) ferredoxin domain-containing protein [Cyanobacteria bacterium SBC]
MADFSTSPSLDRVTSPNEPRPQVFVCQHRSCANNGSAETLQAFQRENLEAFDVLGCGCLGQCSSGPTVRVTSDETWYCRVKAADVPHIVDRHLKGGEPVEEKLNSRIHRMVWGMGNG